jgi:hypothetical protein
MATALTAVSAVSVLGLAGASHHWPVQASPTASGDRGRHIGRAAPATSSSKFYIQAQILPAATFAVGDSLTLGPDGRSYGAGLTANDVDNSWSTCTCNMDFVVFVFANRAETADVVFRIVSPTGTVVYHYSWPSQKIEVGGTWFSVLAKAAYTTPGTYLAELEVSGQLDGWAPVVFTRS